MVKINQRVPGVDGNICPDPLVASEVTRCVHMVDVAILLEPRYEGETLRRRGLVYPDFRVAPCVTLNTLTVGSWDVATKVSLPVTPNAVRYCQVVTSHLRDLPPWPPSVLPRCLSYIFIINFYLFIVAYV